MDNILGKYIDKCYKYVKNEEKIAALSRISWARSAGGCWSTKEGYILRGDVLKITVDQKNIDKDLRQAIEKRALIEKQIKLLIRTAKRRGVKLPFEELAQRYGLSSLEKLVFMTIFYNRLFNVKDGGIPYDLTVNEVFKKLGVEPSKYLQIDRALKRLKRLGLIFITISTVYVDYWDKDFRKISKLHSLFPVCSSKIEINPQIFEYFKLDTPINDRRKFTNNPDDNPDELPVEIETTILQVREPRIDFEQIILNQEQTQLVNQVIYHASQGIETLSNWGFDKTIKYGKGVVVLFYGPPGTGKTATAEAIAHRLGKRIGIVSYDQLLSKWLGESEKNLVLAFNEARETDCVLLFDEADSLFACRLTESRSVDRMHNYMTNILMQELERFDGVVILTTNREYAFDEAFPRRILYKIKFDIPGPAERARIWRALIPPEAPLAPDVDFNLLAEKYALTGGEIKNAILKAVKDSIYLGNECITMELLSKHAQAELENVNRKTKKSVGFKAE